MPGFIQTQKIALPVILEEIPYLGRDFERNVGNNVPTHLGGLGDLTDINSFHIRPQFTRTLPSHRNNYLRDAGGIQYMHCDWQQADYRPLYFKYHTKTDIKNYARGSNLHSTALNTFPCWRKPIDRIKFKTI